MKSPLLAVALALVTSSGWVSGCWQFSEKAFIEKQATGCGEAYVALANALAQREP